MAIAAWAWESENNPVRLLAYTITMPETRHHLSSQSLFFGPGMSQWQDFGSLFLIYYSHCSPIILIGCSTTGIVDQHSEVTTPRVKSPTSTSPSPWTCIGLRCKPRDEQRPTAQDVNIKKNFCSWSDTYIWCVCLKTNCPLITDGGLSKYGVFSFCFHPQNCCSSLIWEKTGLYICLHTNDH